MADHAGPFLATAQGLTSWAIAAGEGRVCIYARAARIPRGGVGERARQMHAQGLVVLKPLRRVAGGACLFDYRVERTGLPWSQARVAPDERGLSAEARLLLDLLVQLADLGERCPPDRDLAALLGFKRAEQASRRLGELKMRHLIRVTHVAQAGEPVRVVTIAETGKATWRPAGGEG